MGWCNYEGEELGKSGVMIMDNDMIDKHNMTGHETMIKKFVKGRINAAMVYPSNFSLLGDLFHEIRTEIHIQQPGLSKRQVL